MVYQVGVSRNGLAHILADGSLDRSWAASTNAAVTAIAVPGSVVYVGGFFTTVNGSVPRHHLAAFDASSGAVLPFDPDLNATVESLQVVGSTLYAGGDFTVVNGGTVRKGLAALDVRDESPGLATAFDPNIVGGARVWSIQVAAGLVYAGGGFSAVNGSVTRNAVAAFDATTGAVTPFNPNVRAGSGAGNVASVVLAGSTLYVGGDHHRQRDDRAQQRGRVRRHDGNRDGVRSEHERHLRARADARGERLDDLCGRVVHHRERLSRP